MGGADSVNVSAVPAVPAGRWLAMRHWQSTTHSAGCTTSSASTKGQVPGGGGRGCLSAVYGLLVDCHSC